VFKSGSASERAPGRSSVTISANVPMTGSYDRLQVALSVLLAVSDPYAALGPAGHLHSPIVLINFICMNCWERATTRASHSQEAAC
jgi:hypothetical protein